MKRPGREGPVDLCRWLLRLAVVSSIVFSRSGTHCHQILYGRCYSYCIRTHLMKAPDKGRAGTSSDDGQVVSVPENPIRTCQRHHICRWCLYVCDRPEDNFTDSESCRRDCRHTRTGPRSGARQACTDACGFLGRASGAKGGTCPAPVSLNGFESACVTSCHADRDCEKAEHKCCINDCGSVCTEPYDVHILPPVPTDISFKVLQNGGVMVKWDTEGAGPGDAGSPGVRGKRKQGDPSSPVVYMLRWWCSYTSGVISLVTDEARTRIDGYPYGIFPGHRCFFMAAAINVHGSRGFSPVSAYIKKFFYPSPPLHLEKAGYKLHDGKVDVTIQWQPPLHTDRLPVHKYQVSWSDKLPKASPHYQRLHMHRRTLNADATSFTLYSLEPGTIYFFQVSAVVKWKDTRKIGKPASIYIETYSPPQPANNKKTAPEVHSPEAESPIVQVSVNQSYFQDSVLKTAISWTLRPGKSARKYLIYWRQEACARISHQKRHQTSETSATSHERSFTLFNLEPDCEYAVRVHPVNSRGRTGAATVTSFVTPPCRLIWVVQGDAPVCDSAEPPGQVKGLHSETSKCVTVIRWEPVTSNTSAMDVTSYDVTWGETEWGSFSGSTVIYSSDPRETSLASNQTSLQLGDLRAGQHYTVQVAAVSLGGYGPPAVLHLRVPHSETPCRRHGDAANASRDVTQDEITLDGGGAGDVSREEEEEEEEEEERQTDDVRSEVDVIVEGSHDPRGDVEDFDGDAGGYTNNRTRTFLSAETTFVSPSQMPNASRDRSGHSETGRGRKVDADFGAGAGPGAGANNSTLEPDVIHGARNAKDDVTNRFSPNKFDKKVVDGSFFPKRRSTTTPDPSTKRSASGSSSNGCRLLTSLVLTLIASGVVALESHIAPTVQLS